MDNKKKDTVRFSISLPTDLNEKVEADVEEHGRDKNKQINWILKKYYESSEAFSETSSEAAQKATVS
jgi:metal-responsive CopG/Arc/MetJ family transcriptional regulator